MSGARRGPLRFGFWVLLSLVTLFPIYWMFLVSGKSRVELFGRPSFLIDSLLHRELHQRDPDPAFQRYMINSIIVATSQLRCSSPCSRCSPPTRSRAIRSPARTTSSSGRSPTAWRRPPSSCCRCSCSSRSVFAVGDWQLFDTRIGLILLYCVFNLPFAIWMLKGIIDAIPKELDEAAMVDGAGTWQVLTRVIVPLARPGLAVTAILTWVFAWNEYLFAATLTSVHARTITTGLAEFVTVTGTNWGADGRDGDVDAAAGRHLSRPRAAPHRRRPHLRRARRTERTTMSLPPHGERPPASCRSRPTRSTGCSSASCCSSRIHLFWMRFLEAHTLALCCDRDLGRARLHHRALRLATARRVAMKALVLEREGPPVAARHRGRRAAGAARRAHRPSHRRRLRQRRALLHATAAIGPFVVEAPMILGHEAAGDDRRGRREVTRASSSATGSAWSPASPTRRAAPRASASTTSTRQGALLGDAAGARRAAADRRASGRLHLPPARQRVLRGGRHGRAARGRHARARPRPRSRRATSRW